LASSDDLERWYQEAGQYRNLDPNLLRAVARTESGERVDGPDSSAGAMGLMQIMPETAKRLGIDPRDPQQAIYGAARLLDENLKHYGNLPDALRAYNGGTDRARWGNKETMAYPGKVAANLSSAPSATTQEPDYAAIGKSLDASIGQTSNEPDYTAMGRALDTAPGASEVPTNPRANPSGILGKAKVMGEDTANAAGRAVGTAGAGVEDILSYLSSIGHHYDNAASQYLAKDANAVRATMDADASKRSGDYGARVSNVAGEIAGDLLTIEDGAPLVKGLTTLSQINKAGRVGRAAANVIRGEGPKTASYLNNALAAKVEGDLDGRNGWEDGRNALLLGGAGALAAKGAGKAFKYAGKVPGKILNALDPEGRYAHAEPEAEEAAEATETASSKGSSASVKKAEERAAQAERLLENAHTEHADAVADVDATAAAESQARRASGYAADPTQKSALDKAAADARAQHEAAMAKASQTHASIDQATHDAGEAHEAAEAIRAIDEAAPRQAGGGKPSTPEEQAQASRIKILLSRRDIPGLSDDVMRTFGRGGPLQLSPSSIPGVSLTLAEQSGNPGIAGMQHAMRSMDPGIDNAMTLRQESNNQAIKDYFKNEIAKTPEDIQVAERDRQRFGERAFAEDGHVFGSEQPVYAAHIPEKLEEIARNPRTPEHIVRALAPFKETIARDIDPETGMVMPSHLYAARRTVNHAYTSAMDSEGRDIKESLPSLSILRSAMDHTIERGAPGYKQAMKDYADMSREIDEMRWLQSQTTDTTAGTMTHGKIKGMVERMRKEAIAKRTRPSDAISPATRKKIATLLETTAKIEHLNKAKTIGSNTPKTLFAADTISGLMSPMMKTAKIAGSVKFPGSGLVVDALDGVAGWRTGKLKQEALDYTANALMNPDAALLNRLKAR